MKRPISPADLHQQYVEAISVLLGAVPDIPSRQKAAQGCDPFFRSCALGVWKADGGSIDPEYVDYYNAIYLRGDLAPSTLFWELNSNVADYPGFETPDFFYRLQALDLMLETQLSRHFIDVFTLLCSFFALVDGAVSEQEAAFVERCVKQFTDSCDLAMVKALETKPASIRDFMAPGTNTAREDTETSAEEKTSEEPREEPEPRPSLEEAMAELEELYGLASVKADVKSMVNLAKVNALRKEQGLPVPALSLHMVFTGNPGTGKTTVARLLAKIYHALGVLSKGQLVEVDRGKLVAGYVGQTAIKTQEAIDRARGGVLFIDEAYALANKSETGSDFGGEAIEVLLKNMEDHREDLIVIAAGYTGLMEDFLHANPGLESRFNKHIHFDDYTGQELQQIFLNLCKKNGYVLDREARDCAGAYFQRLYEGRDENFGNARDVRNFFERAVAAQTDRVAALAAPDRAALMALETADLRGAAGEERFSEAGD